MNTKRLVALIIAAVLLFFSIGTNMIISILKTDFFSNLDSVLSQETLVFENVLESGNFNQRIVQLTVNGTIQDIGKPNVWESDDYNHQTFLKQLNAIMNDDSIKAVLL